MDLELVTVGTELLLGFTVDTNAALLARLVNNWRRGRRNLTLLPKNAVPSSRRCRESERA